MTTLTELEVPARGSATTAVASCRLCGARLDRTLLDFGRTPPASGTRAFAQPDRLCRLHILVCDACLLVQVHTPLAAKGPVRQADLSLAAEEQARRFTRALIQRLGLNERSLVVEIAAGLPTLLPHLQAAAVPVLADTPAFSAAAAMEIAARAGRADVVIANDVLPVVPDLFDFAAGFAALLRPKGIVVLQVPHLLPVIQQGRFDDFRHDRRFYLSVTFLEPLLRSVGLRVFDAETLPDHGGSLRIYACHPRGPHAARPALKAMRQAEAAAGLDRPEAYSAFAARVAAAKQDISEFLGTRIAAGRRVAAYGLATRGTTLLNACRIGPSEVAWVADPTGLAKGRFLPGCGLPVVSAEALADDRPSDLLILPWTRAAELAASLQALRQKGTQFWIMTPAVRRV